MEKKINLDEVPYEMQNGRWVLPIFCKKCGKYIGNDLHKPVFIDLCPQCYGEINR